MDKFGLRLPEGLRDRLADAAKVNHRSMNAEMVSRLMKSLEVTYKTSHHEVRDAPLLSLEEAELLNRFRSLSARKQKAILDLMG